MFKKQTSSYRSSGTEQSPFAKASQEWDNRIGSARVQARNWRVMALACIGLVMVLTGSLLYLATQTRIEAYVVEVDPHGRIGEIQLIDQRYTPTTAQVAYHLAQLVRLTRSYPTDQIVLKENWLRAYYFLAGDAVTTMNEYAASANLFDPRKRGTAVSVEIHNVIQKSDGTSQIRWKETTYEHGSMTGVVYWTGLFTTKINSPRTAKAVFHNPIGVYITSFNWSQELGNVN